MRVRVPLRAPKNEKKFVHLEKYCYSNNVKNGHIVQRLEQAPLKRCVAGSNPAMITKNALLAQLDRATAF